MSDFDIKTKRRSSGPHPYEQPYVSVPLTAKGIEGIFDSCGDFQKRVVDVGLRDRGTVTVVWIDGVVDGSSISKDILRPLTAGDRLGKARSAKECVELMLHGAVYANTVQERSDAATVADDLTHGWCAVIFDSIQTAVTFEVRTTNVRSISPPTLEKSVKGAKDAFVETLRINTSLVRRRICSPKLKLISSVVGRKSATRCAIMYVEGVADQKIVDELTSRLDSIDVDGLITAGYIDDYIVGSPRSPFPQVIHTERPDRFSTQLLNGRVGLLVDGMSIGFMIPVSLPEFMRVSQDMSTNYTSSTALTLLRWASLIMTLALPAFFVAIAMYHQEMIPTKLLLSMVQSKQDVPFSVAVEVIGMLLAFALLQEAGLRLPDPVGDTVSIIGALIVGQSAVEARVVSPVAVIVVALSAIAGFTLPSRDMGAAFRLCRMLLVFAAVACGLFGVAAGICMLIWYLCGLESYGVNYFSPLSDGRPSSLAKTIIRVPKPDNKYRDPDLRTPDRRRQG